MYALKIYGSVSYLNRIIAIVYYVDQIDYVMLLGDLDKASSNPIVY